MICLYSIILILFIGMISERIFSIKFGHYTFLFDDYLNKNVENKMRKIKRK